MLLYVKREIPCIDLTEKIRKWMTIFGEDLLNTSKNDGKIASIETDD